MIVEIMSSSSVFEWVGLVSAALMPLWNIPLIFRILRRKSSKDISLAWALGVEFCVLAMLPSALLTSDPVLKVLGISNSIFFTAVTVVVLLFHSS
jgi:uncharacterized protein with PQ loop repeat